MAGPITQIPDDTATGGPVTTPDMGGGPVDDSTYQTIMAGLQGGDQSAPADTTAPASFGQFSRGPDGALVTPPAQPQEPQPQPGTSQTKSTSVGSSQSAGYTGFSGAKHAQIQRGPGAALNAQIARDTGDIAASYKPYVDDLEANSVDQQLANEHIAATEAAKQAYAASAKLKTADAYNRYKNEEEAAYAESQVQAAQAFQAYKTSLAEWGAMGVNSGRLFGRASASQKVSMGAAAFIHDFLGAKGIKTSAMDTLNGLIDRDISAQIANMNHKGQVTAGFKQLWDMQRAMSSSDAEARARIRGFALESLSNEIAAGMSEFDSRLVQDKAIAARTLIEQEKIKNQLGVQDHIWTAANQMAGHRVAAAGDQLRAATENYRISSSAKQAELDRQSRERIATKENQVSPFSNLLADQSKTGNNEYKWRFKPEVAKDSKRVANIQDKVIKTQQAMDALSELQGLQEKADSIPPGFERSKVLSELARREQALRDAATNAFLYDDSGKAVNEKEFERHASMIPAKGWFTNGSNRRIIAQTLKLKMDETQRLINATTDPITQGDPAYGYRFDERKYAPGEYTENSIVKEGRDSPTVTPGAEAAGRVNAPGSNKAAEHPYDAQVWNWAHTSLLSGEDAWKKFRETNGKAAVERDLLPYERTLAAGRRLDGKEPEDKMPESFVQMAKLANETYDDPNTADDDYNAKNARTMLEAWATLGTHGELVVVPPGAPPGKDGAPDVIDANDPVLQQKIEMARFFTNYLQSTDK